MLARRLTVGLTVVVAVVAAIGAGAGGRAAARQAVPPALQPPTPAQQRPPSFTSGTVLVPIDVRVYDPKTGKAVSDLAQEDFTVLEDGVPQPIRHFERRFLDPGATGTPATRPAMRESALGVAPQTSRIFLFMLGRGRLQEPSKALDALQ